MKKYLLVVFMIFALTSTVFADSTSVSATGGSINMTNSGAYGSILSPTATGGSATGGAGGNATIQTGAVTNAPIISPTNTNLNTNINAPEFNNKIDVKNTNTNVNTNVNDVDIKNTNTQGQGQSQGQSQKQGQGQDQKQGQMNNWTQTYIQERELPAALPVIPQVIPLIQGGKVGDVTGQVVRFAIAAKPYAGELVIKILKVVNGSIFDRVRLEDIETDLLKAYVKLAQGVDGKKVRYLVQYKDSAMGSGLSLGGAGSVSALNGGSNTYGGSGSIGTGIGYTRSTVDPMYIIKFFQVE